jgi:hypothetical protein
MKALVLTAAIIAAVAVTAPAALAKQQGYRYLGDTLSTEVQAQPSQGYYYLGDTLSAAVQPTRSTQGINIITDTLGGKGQPTTVAPTSAEDAQRYAPGWRPSTGQPGSSGPESLPYAYGGPSTVVDESPQPVVPQTKPYIYGGAPPAVAQAGSGFYRAHRSPPVVTTTGGDGFNWSDAGLGAVTGFGALFLLAGSSILVRKRRQLAV